MYFFGNSFNNIEKQKQEQTNANKRTQTMKITQTMTQQYKFISIRSDFLNKNLEILPKDVIDHIICVFDSYHMETFKKKHIETFLKNFKKINVFNFWNDKLIDIINNRDNVNSLEYYAKSSYFYEMAWRVVGPPEHNYVQQNNDDDNNEDFLDDEILLF